MTRFMALLLAAALLAVPAGALAMSAAEYEEQLIKEGKAQNGEVLAPAPPPDDGSGGSTGAPVAPPPPAAPVTADSTAIIVAIVFIIVGALAFADVRRMTTAG